MRNVYFYLLLRAISQSVPSNSSEPLRFQLPEWSIAPALSALTPLSPCRRIFGGRLDRWKPRPRPTATATAAPTPKPTPTPKPRPACAAPASPRSPCAPFSWFHESRKGSYSFGNLPTPPSPLQPSSETLISDKKGSKVENTRIKKANQDTPNLCLLCNLWEAFSACVCALDPRHQCDNTALNSAWLFPEWGEESHLTITFLNTVPF